MLEKSQCSLLVAHLEYVRTEAPKILRPVLGHDLVQYLGRKAIFADTDQVFDGRQCEEPLLEVGIECVGIACLRSRKPVRQLAVPTLLVPGLEQKISNEINVRPIVQRIEAAHISELEHSCPIWIENRSEE